MREWHEAADKERRLRDAAFLKHPYEIAGVNLRIMSLQDLVDLTAIKSPLVSGGNPTAEDLARFLWILSQDFAPGENGFLSFIATLDLGNAVHALRDTYEYIDFVFLDRPCGESKGNPGVSFAASFADFFQSEYGWDEEKTLAKPLPRLFQLQRAALLRKGHKIGISNRMEDAAKAAYLIALNAIPVEHRDAWYRAQEEELKHG